MGRLAATSPGAGKTGCAWLGWGGEEGEQALSTKHSLHSAPSTHCNYPVCG